MKTLLIGNGYWGSIVKSKLISQTDLLYTANSKDNLDNILNKNETVLAHKLCGAGNGGFFLVFSEKESLTIPYQSVKIDVEPNGVVGRKL